VNLLATVVGKFLSEDGNYGAITLDDGSETIRVKAFGPDVQKIKDVEMGMLVRFVGKIKEYNDERYLAPDFVKIVTDPNWIIVQKLELGKAKPSIVKSEPEEIDEPTSGKPYDDEPKIGTPAEKPKPVAAKEQPSSEPLGEPADVEDNSVESDDMPNFIEIISRLDSGDGADMNIVIIESKLPEEDAKNMIVNLLKDGEIYEPRKGKLKIL